MSTVAEVFSTGTNFSMNSSSASTRTSTSTSSNEIQPMIDQDHDMSEASGCSTADADPETLTNLSDDDNTSCSNSEMGCDSINANATRSPNNSHQQRSSSSTRTQCSNNNNNNHHNNNHIKLHNIDNNNKRGSKSENNSISSSASSPSSSSRRNKRKNFKPRNIVEYAGSEEEGVGVDATAAAGHSFVKRIRVQQHDEEVDQNEDDEGDGDADDLRSQQLKHPVNADVDDGSDSDDTPLDLSEVQNDPKGLWRRTHFLNDALSPKHGYTAPKSQNELNSERTQTHASLSSHPPLQYSGHYPSHSLSHFTPVDLRLGLVPNHIANDFAESAMKELLGLYGSIAENLRQGDSDGKLASAHQHSNGQQSSKIGLPENMSRFLAALHETASLKPEPVDRLGQDNNSVYKISTAQNHVGHLLANSANAGSSNSSAGGSDAGAFEDGNKNYCTRRTRKGQAASDGDKPDFKSNGESLLLNRSGDNSTAQSKGHKTKNSAGKSSSRGLTSFPVIREGLLGKGSGPVDYTRYVKRYGSCVECGYQNCRDLNYKEHFHCLDCSEGARVFVKKEEMIRHFKWHKKRDESLQHGFMRYSPSDDCADRFQGCPHNRKQTHYHCLQDGCEKVYISTSDVQMHANYHRKDSAIIQEGFQRFRAAEDCGADHCAFRHQHTTHFHCRREECSYTFKNKADMEKHKSYHIKDEQLNRDGFKKFMKHEICNFATCRFSRVCNHIHCIREGCNYVLHSSGQLYSHKRKHERRDAELAYRKFKLAQTVMRGTISSDLTNPCWSASLALSRSENNAENSDSSQDGDGDSAHGDSEDIFKKFISKCSCDASDKEHYHCRAENCRNALFGNAEAANEHSQNHELEDRISSLAYFTVDPANFDAQDSTIPCVSAKCSYQNKEKHYHCLWDDCPEIILATDQPFKRLEHFRTHEKNQRLDLTSEKDDNNDSASMEEGLFKRKRGRPPKNRIIEFPSGANDAVFTSFKLPKPRIPGQNVDRKMSDPMDLKDPIGFISYPGKASCPDASCPFNSTSCSHYHCAHPRCHFAVKDVHRLSLHLRDFHSNVDILDGYAYFDRSSNCHEAKCEFNCNSNHFHCLRDGYIFQRYSSMSTHESECHESKSNPASSDEDESPSSTQVIKSNGIFYPQTTGQSTLSNGEGNNNDPVDLSSGPTNGVHYMEAKSITDHSLSRILQLPESSETQFGPDSACGRPFCKLKRKCHYHCHLCNQAFSEIEKLRPHVMKHSSLSTSGTRAVPDSDPESESSLSLKDPCDLRSETILSKLKTETTISSNHPANTSPQMDLSSVSAFAPTSLSNFMGYPGAPNPYFLLQQNPFTSLYAGMMFGHGYPSPLSLSHPELLSSVPTASPNPSSLLLSAENPPSISPLTTVVPSSPSSASSVTPLKRPPSNASSPASPPSDNKRQRMQLRILKDEPVPEGYLRFRFNEDCSYPHCGYREHQTHFHCTREDCGYSFCDKTRFVQHTARHERLDTLMGGDFKQYRANVACGREDCAYVPTANGTSQAIQNKASHFHCCKCPFVCTDTNKVVAHRRQHQKLDSIMAAGFEKFTPSQECNIDGCIHAQKQTHYHCLKCNYAVLGLSQMSAHKYRHSD